MLVKLDDCINEMIAKHPEALIFIRGDANVNRKDKTRNSLLHKLCEDWNLVMVDIPHPTYHHFTGDGASDSCLDVLIHSLSASENLSTIYCKLDDPLLTSHHDILLSSFQLPRVLAQPADQEYPLAPRVPNTRVKIQWSESGIRQYKEAIDQNLARMRTTWLNPSSPAFFSVLIQSTNSFLNLCAKSTNKYIDLGKECRQKSCSKPHAISRSEKRVLHLYKALKNNDSSDHRNGIFDIKEEKRKHRRLLRLHQVKKGWSRDKYLDRLLSKNPTSAYHSIKKAKYSRAQKVSRLIVGNMTYLGDSVPDGIFESVRFRKTESTPPNKDPSAPKFDEEYKHIIDICKSGRKIPEISREKSSKILHSIRKNVNDFYSVTASHYLHAGVAGEDHFHFLLNTVISNVNLGGIAELNTIFACVLLKSQGKDRTSERSYRTISTCPLVAKALDFYIRELCLVDWNYHQSDTQYQGERSSHDLASLLLTEVIQHSLHTKKKPVFALFLDAKSAFDRVLKEVLVRKLFLAGTDGHDLLYLDQRLGNRQTYCEFDKKLMGPIYDTKGLEQGGLSSSDLYKMYNNEQSDTAQRSGLGVSVFDEIISAIALADDTVLVSDDIIHLKLLLFLTIQYCNKYSVKLVPDKTKLVAFSIAENAPLVNYAALTLDISLYGQKIPFSTEAEHLGILRTSFPTNMPNILVRLQAHDRKLFSLLPAGLALGHHANPAACIKVEQQYALPVLLSGLGALVLRKVEVNMISTCYKNTLQRLMKLHDKTPDCAVYLLAGSLPGKAILHLRQLSLFLMICHLPGDILHTLAWTTLVQGRPSTKSWFQEIREICILYGLPHPLSLLQSQPTKESFKKLCKEKVHDYWRAKLSTEALSLCSLKYLRPEYLSPSKPHPIFTSLDGNPYQAKAAKVQALFLPGRYYTWWSENIS